MKKWLILLTLVFTFGFVAASVDVHNYSVDKDYSPFTNITGEINLTIIGEDYFARIISNDGDSIGLGDFLDKTGNIFTCSPPDCSIDYSSSSAAASKSFSVTSGGKVYAGFVIEGEDVNITDMSFDIQSTFGISSKVPLVIEFFEDEDWDFHEFSDELLNTKDYGCYSGISPVAGPRISDTVYCEMVTIPDTDRVFVGAEITGTDTGNLKMVVYPETGTGGEWDCEYDPNSAVGGCYPDTAGVPFSSGDYWVCVTSASGDGKQYKINTESTGETCGFVKLTGPYNSDIDYGIFAQGLKYADASFFDSSGFEFEDLIGAANELIGEKYGGDCSTGCILPMVFSGVSQNIVIDNLALEFKDGDDLADVQTQIYDLGVIPATVDFDSITDGLIDLNVLGFSVSKTMKYIVSLSGVELFSELIDVLPAPIILSVFPLDPPAGVPVKFFAGIEYSENKTLSYSWTFGDNETEKTKVPRIEHVYDNMGNYTLTLTVSAGGNLTSTRSFSVNTISPEEAVNVTLDIKRDSLEDVFDRLTEFPEWYSDTLTDLIQMDFYEGELDRLDKEFTRAFQPSDFVDIANDLYALDVPAGILTKNFESSHFITNLADVDIEPVEIIGGASTGATNDAYAAPILNWQLKNVDVEFTNDVYTLITYSGQKGDLLNVYSYKVKSNDFYESYFVINRPYNELYFEEGSAKHRKAGDYATVVILPPEGEASFSFYYEGADPTSVFVSPRLSSIVIEASIDDTCNHNLVCEDGEDYKGCRSDCKPIKLAIILVIVALLFLLTVYTVLQVWYKHRYEIFLFKDQRQSYNLLMYVTNARARGMSDQRIAAQLRKQGWSSERVTYIVNKSAGRRTGLDEIIPITMIMAYFRNKSAKKRVSAQPQQQGRVATQPQQQTGRNINKSRLPRKV